MISRPSIMHGKESFGWFCEISRLKGMPPPQGAVVASRGSQGIRGGGNALRAIPRQDPRFGYTVGGGWCLEAELREILAEFDNDCRDLSRFCSDLLRRELATQIEHEVLRFSDPDKQAVLVIALKHFDSL